MKVIVFIFALAICNYKIMLLEAFMQMVSQLELNN
ncbi:hypothetical protein SAMN05444267_101248 [Chryseobacterium polytrichastri]|uniref:Uncharacterized protein n=1 Tax=Chryseobacterium polytrichastri TaxID=1302687 RepID=A0A1M6Y0V0_9FLAO|nr:hypothetical protein SAMN05444267_101248 [Chryseobacterium polytrichastri]